MLCLLLYKLPHCSFHSLFGWRCSAGLSGVSGNGDDWLSETTARDYFASSLELVGLQRPAKVTPPLVRTCKGWCHRLSTTANEITMLMGGLGVLVVTYALK